MRLWWTASIAIGLLAVAGGVWWAVGAGGLRDGERPDDRADDRVDGRVLWELGTGTAIDVRVHAVENGLALIGLRGDDESSTTFDETLQLVAADTGQVLWQIDRQGSVAEAPPRLYESTVIHAAGTDPRGVMGRDGATGAERWSRPGRFVSAPGAGVVLFEFSNDTIELLDPNGATKWRIDAVAIHGVASDAVFAIRRAGDDTHLMAFDIDDGTELWSEPRLVDPATYESVRDALLSSEPADFVVVRDGPDLVALDGRSGEERWRRPLDSNTPQVEVVVDRVIGTILGCETRRDGLVVRAIDPVTGLDRWETALPSGSGIVGYNREAMAVSARHMSTQCLVPGLPGTGPFTVYDLASGEPVWTESGTGRVGEYGLVSALGVGVERTLTATVVDFSDGSHRDLVTGEVVFAGTPRGTAAQAGQTTVVRDIDEATRLVSFAAADGSWRVGGFELAPVAPHLFFADGVLFIAAGDALVAID